MPTVKIQVGLPEFGSFPNDKPNQARTIYYKYVHNTLQQISKALPNNYEFFMQIKLRNNEIPT